MRPYPSPDDIQTMKSSGYDPLTITEAQELLPKWHEVQALRQHIIHAFAGVILGDGVGLYQAQAIDDYLDQHKIALARAKDEKQDWQKLQVQDLNICSSSLSFFDAKGMRFHLPAYLLADLEGQYHLDLIYTLCENSLSHKQFCLFSPEQCSAVADYLQFMLYENDMEYYKSTIIIALTTGYWSGTS